MTGFTLRLLGLATTGLVYPSYQGLEDVNEFMQVQQQIIEDEAIRNYYAEQEQIIIEDYFLFLEKIGKIKYARGCMGEYTPATRSAEKQKRVKCSDNAFDCAGLVKAYGIAKGILTPREAGRLNSQTIVLLGEKKNATLAKRGDFTSRKGYGDRSTGNLSTHFAMVSRDYTGGNILWIYDNANGPNNNTLGERAIRVTYSNGNFNHVGRYRISVYSNGLVETAKQREITVDSRIDIDTVEERPQMSKYDPDNPMGFSATMSGYAYDSLANRILSLWYNYNQDLDMMAKFIAEAHFNPEAIGKKGEKGICQLLPNATNNVWINDPRWSDPMRQAKICMEKWEAVPENNRDMIRRANGDTEIDNIILH